MTPEARARQSIDALLDAAGWAGWVWKASIIYAPDEAVRDIDIREFQRKVAHGWRVLSLVSQNRRITSIEH